MSVILALFVTKVSTLLLTTPLGLWMPFELKNPFDLRKPLKLSIPLEGNALLDSQMKRNSRLYFVYEITDSYFDTRCTMSFQKV